MVGSSRSTIAMGNFNEFIADMGLMDLPLEGGSSTWSISTTPPRMSRIDRFLVCPVREERFSNLRQKLMPQTLSDYFPVLLDINGITGGRGSYKLCRSDQKDSWNWWTTAGGRIIFRGSLVLSWLKS